MSRRPVEEAARHEAAHLADDGEVLFLKSKAAGEALEAHPVGVPMVLLPRAPSAEDLVFHGVIFPVLNFRAGFRVRNRLGFRAEKWVLILACAFWVR